MTPSFILSFAQTVVRERNARQREGYPEVILRETIAFRGLPHSHYDWEQNRRCSAQAEQWRRDGATIELRDLKYTFQRTAMAGKLQMLTVGR